MWFRYLLIAIETILQTCLLLEFTLLITLRMPNLLHRIFIAWPSAIQFSTIFFVLFFVFPLPLMCWLPYTSILLILPVGLSLIGLYQTTYTPKSLQEWDNVIVPHEFDRDYANVSRIKVNKTKFSKERINTDSKKIRIVQITDPHLGSMTSVSRLQTICEQAMEANPDLIFLTGDFFNVEAYLSEQQTLYNALLPLKKVANRTFACLGNHDKEHCAREIAETTLERLGIKLLVEEHTEIQTDSGLVQIIGLDFSIPFASYLQKHVRDICASVPKNPNAVLRVVLLHDPTGFSHIPNDDQSLVLSGHTHGGQIGLLSLGINLTMVGLASGTPDQGYFGYGKNRLYVNRAQGCRTVLGTQLVRLGVPPEFTVFDINL